MLNASRDHLREAGESYLEHMRFAWVVGTLAAGAGLACMIHAIVPALCPKSCSRTVGLLQMLFADRSKLGAVSGESSGVLAFVVLIGISSLTAIVTAASIGNPLIAAVVTVQAYALPLIYLVQNPGLEPLARA